jgi:antitoxin HicB
MQFEIALSPEPEGGYSVIVPPLAGVVTEGETIDECVANAIDAIEGALLVYKDCGEPVPFRVNNLPVLPENCVLRRVDVNVQ